jgi:hypothetical protein
MKTITEIENATDSQLLSFYNKHNPHKTFDRIGNRAKFEEWCIETLAELEEEAADSTGDVTPVVKPVVSAVSDASVFALQAVTAHLNGHASPLKTAPQAKSSSVVHRIDSPPASSNPVADEAARTSNAARVSASWADAGVAAARLTRDGVNVTVEGVCSSYKSVNEAFRALSLPVQKHIRFRLKLKASRAEVFEHEGKKYHFTIG